jgi:hypothetical protein
MTGSAPVRFLIPLLSTASAVLTWTVTGWIREVVDLGAVSRVHHVVAAVDHGELASSDPEKGEDFLKGNLKAATNGRVKTKREANPVILVIH